MAGIKQTLTWDSYFNLLLKVIFGESTEEYKWLNDTFSESFEACGLQIKHLIVHRIHAIIEHAFIHPIPVAKSVYQKHRKGAIAAVLAHIFSATMNISSCNVYQFVDKKKLNQANAVIASMSRLRIKSSAPKLSYQLVTPLRQGFPLTKREQSKHKSFMTYVSASAKYEKESELIRNPDDDDDDIEDWDNHATGGYKASKIPPQHETQRLIDEDGNDIVSISSSETEQPEPDLDEEVAEDAMIVEEPASPSPETKPTCNDSKTLQHITSINRHLIHVASTNHQCTSSSLAVFETRTMSTKNKSAASVIQSKTNTQPATVAIEELSHPSTPMESTEPEHRESPSSTSTTFSSNIISPVEALQFYRSLELHLKSLERPVTTILEMTQLITDTIEAIEHFQFESMKKQLVALRKNRLYTRIITVDFTSHMNTLKLLLSSLMHFLNTNNKLVLVVRQEQTCVNLNLAEALAKQNHNYIYEAFGYYNQGIVAQMKELTVKIIGSLELVYKPDTCTEAEKLKQELFDMKQWNFSSEAALEMSHCFIQFSNKVDRKIANWSCDEKISRRTLAKTCVGIMDENFTNLENFIGRI